ASNATGEWNRVRACRALLRTSASLSFKASVSACTTSGDGVPLLSSLLSSFSAPPLPEPAPTPPTTPPAIPPVTPPATRTAARGRADAVFGDAAIGAGDEAAGAGV